MNKVVVHVGAISQFMRDPAGAVGQDLARRADNVERIATANTSGPVLSRQSGDLQENLDSEVFTDSEGLYALIGTTAIHDEFGYPRFHDLEATGGKPWLRSALREGFR